MTSQKLSIVLLTVSALVLSVLLVVLPLHPQPANAQMTVADRDWTMLTSDVSGAGGDELINVIDTRNEKMIVYQIKNDRLNPVSFYDYGRAFAQARPH